MATPLPLANDQLLTRTKAVISTGDYSSATAAMLITGLTRHMLHKMSEGGELPVRKIGAQVRVFETTALLREAYAHGRLLVTDLLRTAEGDRLDEHDLAAALHEHGVGTWYTLARCGHRPPDWRSWQAWYSGDRNLALAHLAEEQRQHHLEAETLASRGLTRRHLWCPNVPLTFYGQYQQTRYMRLADAGAQVRVVPGHKLTYGEIHGPIPDLEVLPGAVYVRRYTGIGGRDGATRITNTELVNVVHELLHWLYTTHATLLERFTTVARVPA